jgi:lysophospholipase L1-like esterase
LLTCRSSGVGIVPVMRNRTLFALLATTLGTGIVGLSGAWGARAGVRGQRAAAQRVVEMLPVHADWWRERLHHEGALMYLAIGDSAAQGVGATVPSRGYVGLLARRIRHRSRSTLRVVNLSVSGATTWGAVNEQVPKLGKYTPDICTVSIGANDIADFDAVKFERHLRKIYGAVPSHAIVAELPCMFFRERERKVLVANEIVHRVADEFGLTVAPLHTITKRVGLRRTFFNTYGDLFHPNDNGYRIWASAFEPAVDARVDAVAAIRRYLSAREAEDLGRDAGAVASARADEDAESAVDEGRTSHGRTGGHRQHPRALREQDREHEQEHERAQERDNDHDRSHGRHADNALDDDHDKNHDHDHDHDHDITTDTDSTPDRPARDASDVSGAA